ncbi:uncharacterized protein LOC110228260, partial [Arabidopsis lyrata subsp. lyrata]|uniref:uncharacterized protein LOC110228260 n=1 Tax=Arabidopsis lyrata subsp. lyrata TaxID=81972 RepID=UPI000A29B0A0
EESEQGVVQPQLVAEPQQDVGPDVSGRTAVVPGRRAVSEDRAARVSAARSGKKKVSGSTNEATFRVPPDVDVSLRRKVSHGGHSRESSGIVRERGSSAQEVRGVDYSFSFNYEKKNEPFPVSRSSCGDFASKVYGSPHEFPPVDSLLGMNLYQTWACKQIQVRWISIWTGLYHFSSFYFLSSSNDFFVVLSRSVPETLLSIFTIAERRILNRKRSPLKRRTRP